MAYCRKCGKEIGDDYNLCPYCGEPQFSSAVNREISSRDDSASTEARALREIYEHYGAQQVLGNPAVLYNALGDMLGEDGRKLRNQVRMAMDAGLGKLYLEQLQTPAPDFDKRSLALLTEDAALQEGTAKQIQKLFHGMAGFPAPKSEPPKPEAPKAEIPKAEPPRPVPAASPKEHKKPSAALVVVVILIVAALIGGAAMYMNQIGPFAPEPTPVPTATPIYEPTLTPSPEPTATPTPDPTATPTPVLEPTIDPSKWSMMMQDTTLGGEYTTLLGSAYQRELIRTVTFRGSLDGMPNDAWDITDREYGSAQGNGIYAWVTPTEYVEGNGQTLYDLTIAGNGGVKLPPYSGEMFDFYTNAVSIDFGNCVDTSAVESMFAMFRHCESLTSLDLSCFNTSQLTTMWDMFDSCGNLTSVDLSSFDTSKVTRMDSLFKNCKSLTTLDLSTFNTSNVETMKGMFWGCGSLTTLDLSSFDTSKVTDMEYMFNWLDQLTTLDLSSFDTSNVLNMKHMFNNSGKLKTVYASSRFIIGADAKTDSMFDLCPINSVSDFTIR